MNIYCYWWQIFN